MAWGSCAMTRSDRLLGAETEDGLALLGAIEQLQGETLLVVQVNGLAEIHVDGLAVATVAGGDGAIVEFVEVLDGLRTDGQVRDALIGQPPARRPRPRSRIEVVHEFD